MFEKFTKNQSGYHAINRRILKEFHLYILLILIWSRRNSMIWPKWNWENFESIFSFLLWMLINIDTLQGHLKRIKFSFRSGNYCIFSFGTSRMWSYFIIWLSLSMIYKLLEMLTTHYQIKDFVRAVTNEI
jgi:hypothetical protein